MFRYLLAAVIGAAALSIGSGPSEASGASGKIYLWTYYSDATKTTLVGNSMDQCISGDVFPGTVYGEETPHYDREWVGNCPGYLF